MHVIKGNSKGGTVLMRAAGSTYQTLASRVLKNDVANNNNLSKPTTDSPSLADPPDEGNSTL